MFVSVRAIVDLRHAALASVLVLASLAPRPAAASGPGQELRDFVTQANSILIAGEDRELEEIVTAIVALARPMVAFREAAESALAGDWQARTPIERDEFTRMFAAILERALVLRLAGAAKIGRGVDMSFGDESVAGDVAGRYATSPSMASALSITIGHSSRKSSGTHRILRSSNDSATRLETGRRRLAQRAPTRRCPQRRSRWSPRPTPPLWP
jgi:hypothetical protein